eukprot:UN08197
MTLTHKCSLKLKHIILNNDMILLLRHEQRSNCVSSIFSR